LTGVRHVVTHATMPCDKVAGRESRLHSAWNMDWGTRETVENRPWEVKRINKMADSESVGAAKQTCRP